MLKKTCVISNVCYIKCTLNWGLIYKDNLKFVSTSRKLVLTKSVSYIKYIYRGFTVCLIHKNFAIESTLFTSTHWKSNAEVKVDISLESRFYWHHWRRIYGLTKQPSLAGKIQVIGARGKVLNYFLFCIPLPVGLGHRK